MRALLLAGAVAVLVGSLLLSACDHGCTLIGCSDGLVVQLEGVDVESWTPTAEAPGGETRVVECSDASACADFVHLEGFTPEEVTIRWEAGDRVVAVGLAPSYRRYRPNGEDCPPECLQATITLRVGSGSALA